MATNKQSIAHLSRRDILSIIRACRKNSVKKITIQGLELEFESSQVTPGVNFLDQGATIPQVPSFDSVSDEDIKVEKLPWNAPRAEPSRSDGNVSVKHLYDQPEIGGLDQLLIENPEEYEQAVGYGEADQPE